MQHVTEYTDNGDSMIVGYATDSEGREYRARIEYDDCPEMPFNDGGFPTFRIYPRTDSVEHVYGAYDNLTEVRNIDAALCYFLANFGGDYREVFDRWVSIFLEGETCWREADYRVSDYDYVAVSYPALTQSWSCGYLPPELTEIDAWLDGDIFMGTIEEKVTTKYVTGSGSLIEGEADWIPTEFGWLGGLVGEDWAADEMRSELSAYEN